MSGEKSIRKYLLKMTMPIKLVTAFSAIVAILLVSSIVSIVEFRRMSTHVSDLIEDNITTINLSTALMVNIDEYNLKILAAVGKADSILVSDFDARSYIATNDSIFVEMSHVESIRLDSLKLSYDAYIDEAVKLDKVLVNDFMDTRAWYFEELLTKYNDLRASQQRFNTLVYKDLEANSVSFDDNFYRSIMPGTVSVLAGVALCLLLLFFIMVYYVRPLMKMTSSLKNYCQYGQPYRNVFEGDDQLKELNDAVADLVDENMNFRKKLRRIEH